MWTSIRVRVETYEKIKMLRDRGFGKTYDEVIEKLIKEHEVIEQAGKIIILNKLSNILKTLREIIKIIDEDETLKFLLQVLVNG